MITCVICNKEFNTPKQLSWHVKHHNMTNQQYYDTYIKKPNEGYCLTCGKPTSFISMNLGYHQHCNKKCTYIDNNPQIKRLNTNLEKYGYTASFSTKETQDKVKQMRASLNELQLYANWESVFEHKLFETGNWCFDERLIRLFIPVEELGISNSPVKVIEIRVPLEENL